MDNYIKCITIYFTKIFCRYLFHRNIMFVGKAYQLNLFFGVACIETNGCKRTACYYSVFFFLCRWVFC